VIPFHQLPALNAGLNGLCAVFLVLGWINIRRGNMHVHRAFMVSALVTSLLFLTSYLTYHFQAGTTPFRSTGWIRPVYFAILVSHTIMAVVIVPLVLVTVVRALRGRFEAHRKVARVTWPLWMYVSVTGVVIYFLLYHVDPRMAGGDSSQLRPLGGASPSGLYPFAGAGLEWTPLQGNKGHSEATHARGSG
jgi:uncharacterized membrane protein YozB (DUF420 family)